MRLVPPRDEVELGGPAGRCRTKRPKHGHESVPVRSRRRRDFEGRQHLQRVRCCVERIEQPRRRRGTDARKEARGAEARHPVARIVGPPQHRQRVLDVRRFQELESAVLHERNVAPGELELQLRAVAPAPEQHRLRLERHALLALLEHVLGHAARLIGFVADRDEARPRRPDTLGPQILGEALPREADHRVGGIEDRLRRAIVALERHHARGRRELLRKVEDVAHRRGPKRIDRLRIVADDREAPAIRLHRQQDRRLQPIGVLVLVDEDVVEARADLARQRRLVRPSFDQ